ncbi:hypothetical protein [Limimaricola sp.]|uniref:hypothetical protein n=1 Tax=Limimaricola sp. TaxID=2211665 RepID=UPI0040596A4B
MTTQVARDRTIFGKPELSAATAAVLVFLLACLSRVALLDAAPFYDELYHLLAARSWLDSGTMGIAEGTYTRSAAYTRLTAGLFALTGSDTALVARLPNVVFGALFAALATYWVWRRAGRIAGIAVAGLVLFWPSGILLSQFARFYALHGLLFLGGALCFYEAAAPGAAPRRRVLAALGAGLLLWGALQFQETTLVGVLCLLVWFGLCVMLPVIWRSPHRVLILAGLFAAGLTVFALAFGAGVLQALWTEYREAPWDSDPSAYNRVLRDFYPLFWPLTPLLGLLAIREAPRPAGFCAVISALGLVIHSFAGVQNLRYIYYFSPFLFGLWAIGVQAALPTLFEAVRRGLRGLPVPIAGAFAGRALTVAAILFAVLANGAVPRAISLATGGGAPPFVPRLDWEEAHDRVAELDRDGALVVAANDLNAIAYLGRLDLTYSLNWLPEMNRTEFARDPRTGKPMISELASLRHVVNCVAEGVFVTDLQWRPPAGYIDFFSVFETPGIRLHVERAGPVRLLRWFADPSALSDHATCATLPSELRGQPG